jgi:nitrate reductase NapD
MPAELHITSLLVHARPAALADVRAALGAIDGVDVHGASDTGKIVVTLETESSGGIVERLAGIRDLAGVLSAVMVFHQIEPLDQTEGG